MSISRTKLLCLSVGGRMTSTVEPTYSAGAYESIREGAEYHPKVEEEAVITLGCVSGNMV